MVDPLGRSGDRLGLVSDAIGRERAIGIVRGILNRDEQVDNDGRAVTIIVALDHALEAALAESEGYVAHGGCSSVGLAERASTVSAEFPKTTKFQRGRDRQVRGAGSAEASHTAALTGPNIRAVASGQARRITQPARLSDRPLWGRA